MLYCYNISVICYQKKMKMCSHDINLVTKITDLQLLSIIVLIMILCFLKKLDNINLRYLLIWLMSQLAGLMKDWFRNLNLMWYTYIGKCYRRTTRPMWIQIQRRVSNLQRLQLGTFITRC